MSEISGKSTIELVQGDTFNFRVSVSSDISIISSVMFSSGGLSLREGMTRADVLGDDGETDHGFQLSLSPSVTASLKPGTHTYDLTLRFVDESVQTEIYEGYIKVLPKENPAYE